MRRDQRDAFHASVPAMILGVALRLIARQQRQITRLQSDRLNTELAYMRIGRDLIEQFLIAMDRPEEHDRYRERLTVSLGFYRDEIAVKEEQVG